MSAPAAAPAKKAAAKKAGPTFDYSGAITKAIETLKARYRLVL
jgi:hypothetical protein